MLRPHRDVVLVTGAPGAGKTTLAVPLAAELGFALLAKDRIKETLAETLGWAPGGLTTAGLTTAGQATGGPATGGPATGGQATGGPATGGHAGELAWSQRLGAASMELLWALAADSPAVVLEANFWPDDDRHQRRFRELGGHAVEVYCACPLTVALERYASRQASRHPVHAEAHRIVTPEAWARWARPVGIGELVTVDTSVPVDVSELATEVRARLGASCPAYGVSE